MSDHLLYVSVGPVQDFIASARRCQDLWYGSYLLSQLSEACAEAMQEAVSAKTATSSTPLIFPAELSHLADSSVANKILLTIPADLTDQLPAIARAGEEAITERLNQEADLAFNALTTSSAASFFNAQMARQQLNELIEFSWIALPISDYQQSRVDADAVLSARKLSRAWTQISWNQGLEVPKSSLDGARESVIYEAAYDKLSERNRRRHFGVKSGERLCGVGLLKRLGALTRVNNQGLTRKHRPAFHSTSHVAAAPLLTALACPQRGVERRAAVETYIETLKDLNLDLSDYRARAGSLELAREVRSLEGEPRATQRVFGQEQGSLDRPLGYDGYIFYESRLSDLIDDCWREAEELERGRPSAEYIQRRDATLQKATRALRDCLSAFNLKPDQVSKYYGFILADGDHMGALIDALNTPELHRDLSKNLATFAQSCRQLVEERGGSLIYAGGDDVLALAPLHTALDISCELRAHFERSLAPFLAREDVSRLISQRPTLSVGISIAHHLDSMSYALSLARRAEKNAKDAGRNALSVVVSRRSGGEYTTTGRWDGPSSLPARLKALMSLISEGALPHGVPHDLLEAVQAFAPTGALTPQERATWREESREALWREVSRVIRRKRVSQGHQLAEQAQRALLAHLEPYRKTHTGDLAQIVTQLSDEVLIARLLWNSYQNAWSDR